MVALTKALEFPKEWKKWKINFNTFDLDAVFVEMHAAGQREDVNFQIFNDVIIACSLSTRVQ